MITMSIPPRGLSRTEEDRVLRFDESMSRLLAQNFITRRMGWIAYMNDGRRYLSFGSFKIEDTQFATIPDYELFASIQKALAG